jgi:hypothetical protein
MKEGSKLWVETLSIDPAHWGGLFNISIFPAHPPHAFLDQAKLFWSQHPYCFFCVGICFTWRNYGDWRFKNIMVTLQFK